MACGVNVRMLLREGALKSMNPLLLRMHFYNNLKQYKLNNTMYNKGDQNVIKI